MDWTREAKEARKQYIGGSDAAAILGLSRYKTPLQVWAIKTGEVVPRNIDDVVAVKLGVKLEQAVAEFFMEDTGKKLTRANETIFHPKYPFIGANIDRRVVGEQAGFEAKTTNTFKASEWEGEEIPVEYLIQCIHYMAVTGMKAWYIAVLIGNQYFRWKKIERNQKIIDDMIKKEVDFWNNFIVPKVMPMQIMSADSSILYSLFPRAAEESIIELGDDASKICESLDSMKADFKVLDKEIEQQQNILKAMLKTYETGVTPIYKITWKNQKDRRIDTKLLKKEEPGLYEKYAPETEKRVLRIAVKR
jgi:putative phage-type endonuclease